MSFSSKAKNVLDVAAAGLGGLETIGELAVDLLGHELPPAVTDGLKVITSIVDSVKKGIDGSISVQQVEDDLKAHQDRQAANDKAAHDAIDAKYPGQ